MDLPIFKLIISDDPTDLTGVSVISLVKDPAIEVNFVAFSKVDKTPAYEKFSIINEEKQIVCGPAMIANMPIYRKDESGEYFVYADADTIYQIVQKFFKEQRSTNVNVEHNGILLSGVYLFESFIVDSKRGMNPPANYANIPDGSWFTSYKVDNPLIWEAVKAGTVKGFSIEGLFNYQKTPLSIQASKVDKKSDAELFLEFQKIFGLIK